LGGKQRATILEARMGWVRSDNGVGEVWVEAAGGRSGCGSGEEQLSLSLNRLNRLSLSLSVRSRPKPKHKHKA
jgi:hypothetical protein